MKRRDFLKGLLATGAVALVPVPVAAPVREIIAPILPPPIPAMEWYWRQVSGCVVISGMDTFDVPCQVVRSTAYGAAYAQIQMNKRAERWLKMSQDLMKKIHEKQVKLLYGDGSDKSYE